MGRRKRDHERRSSSGRLVAATGRLAGGAVAGAQSARERLNTFLKPIAKGVGFGGLGALAGCFVLWAIREELWPPFLDPDHLPVYVMVSLVAASLMGWGCMLDGLVVLRRKVGWKLGGWLFVLAPLVCAVFGLLAGQEVIAPGEWGQWGGWALVVATWYTPLVVTACLLAYFLTEADLRDGDRKRVAKRSAWSLLLIAPYAFLLAAMVFGVDPDFLELELELEDHLEDTVEELGSWAIVLQVAFAYFLCGASAS